MGEPRQAGDYKKDAKVQVTVPWKRRVLARLARNKDLGLKPANVEQLGKDLAAPKAAMNKLLDLERDPPQLTSSYVKEICELLDVTPPVLEEEGDDPDFAADVLLLRDLDIEARRALMLTAARMPRKRRRR